MLFKIYDFDECTEYKVAPKPSSPSKNQKIAKHVQDDDEEVFEKEDYDDYNQTISNFLMNSVENHQPKQQNVGGFVLVHPWPREQRDTINSLDLDEYRWDLLRGIEKKENLL